MLIGNRIFPYPVLNKNVTLSDYIDTSKFQIVFDTDNEGKLITQKSNIIFKNLHYELIDKGLEELIKQGKAEGQFIVECSASTYRKGYPITSTPKDLEIPVKYMNDTVVVSCYIYAKEDIVNYSSDGFQLDYEGYSFDIDKYDILAVDDGFKFKVDVDPTEDDKVASIFTIVHKESDDGLMTYMENGSKITIALPSQYYDSYDTIKRKSDYNNIAFSMIAIPVLASCLADVQTTDYTDLDDIVENRPWFNAILISYKRVFGKSLTFEDFNATNVLELAQTVLNNASCGGLKDFGDMLTGSEGVEAEEDE